MMAAVDLQAGSAVTLPRGGGAIGGIGETFQPNLFTGTGDFSVPVFCSKGRTGFGPELSLQYSTGYGNGPFGIGWRMSIPRVSRKTEKGIPRYDDSDTFVLSGAEDLVLARRPDGQVYESIHAGYRIVRYRPRTEGLFARIEQWTQQADGDVHWRVTTRDNITSVYGRTPSARVFDLDNTHHVSEWLLEETFDARGNHILHEYAQDDRAPIPTPSERNRTYCQRYLRRVYYGNYPAPPPGKVLKYPDGGKEVGHLRRGLNHDDHVSVVQRRYAFEMVFDYGDWDAVDWQHVEAWSDGDTTQRQVDVAYADHGPPSTDAGTQPEVFVHEGVGDPSHTAAHETIVPQRGDPFSSYRAGFEVRSLRRCRRVLMYHHFRELVAPALIKATNFIYEENPDNRLSFLRKVIVTGYRHRHDDGAYTQRAMPALECKYSSFEPDKQRYKSVEAVGGELPPLSLNDPDYALVDVIGDGLPDVVESTSSGFRYWRNLGDGRLDRPRRMKESPAGFRLSTPGVAFGDMNGDGKPDLLVHTPTTQGYFGLTAAGEWSHRSFQHVHNTPTVLFGQAGSRLLDLTGDGLSDMLVTTDTEFVWFENRGREGFLPARHIPRRRDLNQFPDVFFDDSSQRVRLADMSGDGLNDIVLVHDGRIDYWPNSGYGRFGKRITMERAPRIGAEFDPSRLFLVDLDGSGVADLVYVEFDRVHYWLNRGGNSWSNRRTICGTPVTHNLTDLQFADFFGTGAACLIWSYDRQIYPGANYKVLDFTGGRKPYLLIETANNLGAITRLSYAASTKYYLEDEQRPDTRWLTKLPMPVQVLDRTETIDVVGKTKLTTRYKYHHGYFDGHEREFRGFARVDQFDTEVFEEFARLQPTDPGVENGDRAYYAPPVERRTWFHTGVYYDAEQELDGRQFFQRLKDKEFYRRDGSAFDIGDNTIEPTAHRRDAHRALRGAVLRSELYSLDETLQSVHPYEVIDRTHRVRELQPATKDSKPVFHRVEQSEVTYNYERNPDDPRVVHQIVARVDALGNVTDRLNVAYPRRGTGHDPEQERLHVIYAWNRFINKDANEFHYVGLPCESRTFEVKQPPSGWDVSRLIQPDDLAPLLVDYGQPGSHQFHHFEERHASFDLRLLAWSQTYYRRDQSPGQIDAPDQYANRLPLGAVERLALPYESYQAVLSKGLVAELYGDKVDGALLAEAGYISSGALDSGDAYWPHTVSDVLDYQWRPSGKQSFEAEGFLLPAIAQDPFGSQTKTSYDFNLQGSTRFDVYLFPARIEDALGNVTRVHHDYRVLQPFRIFDVNDSVQEAAFDALGMTIATGVRGHGGEGDRLYKSGLHAELDGLKPDLSEGEIAAYFNAPRTSGSALLQGATTRMIYDLHRFADGAWTAASTVQPAAAATLVREVHELALAADPSLSLRIQHGFAYSDGLGRIVQSKKQAEPAATGPGAGASRWISTGAVVQNNKGQPVRPFEPFFSDHHHFGIKRHGVGPTVFYDPLGRAVATLHPNHSYEKVVFSPWVQESWDVNDTIHVSRRFDPATGALPDRTFDPSMDPDVGSYFERLAPLDYLPTWYDQRMDPAKASAAWSDPERRAAEVTAAEKAGRHAATPAVTHLDSLGRAYRSVADNGNDTSGARLELNKHITLDVLGLDLKVRDQRGIDAFVHGFDMANRKVVVASADAGLKQAFLDVMDQPVASFDANNTETRTVYDALRRPVELWVKIDRLNTSTFSLAEKTIYGESKPNATQTYHRGQIWKSYDGAGRVENIGFDFKGNTMQTGRELLRDGGAQVQWGASASPLTHVFDESAAVALLDPASDMKFVASTTFDALNRVTGNVTPDGTTQQPQYNDGGLLEVLRVRKVGSATAEEFVKAIEYNARGQRTRIEYLNGVITSYEFDPATFRLLTLNTTRSGANTVKIIQDLHYAYDPAANISEIRDTAHENVFNHNTVIEPVCRYSYDAVYRLIEATGREHEAMSPCHYQNRDARNTEFIHLTSQPVTNGQALGNYTRRFEYDDAGNLTLIDHRNRTRNTHWQRIQTFAANSNRLATSKAGCAGEGGFVFSYDDNGNINALPHLPVMTWDFKNQLIEAQLNHGSAPDTAYYQYDGAGQRVRKRIVKSGGVIEERIYLSGYEVYFERVGSTVRLRRDTVHVMDDKSRIALIEEEKDPAQPTTVLNRRVRFQIANHLGSSTLELDDSADANIISYEEYYPYGGSSYLAGRSATEAKAKRYRYSGKERDAESGLYYYGARYYAPWLGRWASCDPIGIVDSINLYQYAQWNPVLLVDRSGKSSQNPFDFTPEDLDSWEKGVDKQLSNIANEKQKQLDNVAEDWFKKGERKSPPPGKFMQKLRKIPAAAYLKAVMDLSDDQAGITIQVAGNATEQVVSIDDHTTTRVTDPAGAGPDPGKGSPDTKMFSGKEIESWEKSVDKELETPKKPGPGGGGSGGGGSGGGGSGGGGSKTDTARKKATELVGKKPGRLKKFGQKLLNIGAERGAKLIPYLGTAAGAASVVTAPNAYEGFIEGVGASELPIAAQVADIALIVQDIGWAAKEAVDPEQEAEQWAHENLPSWLGF